ncbi:hypothetical protein DXG03_001462 [Asterophora parasitica]|uniref:Uncharacterized protein n=1 Tax=Asterophora parasitica TaxID=117018 RepID=A0A9P7GHA5_9AGAR|nr:hypothetical protein DXG03_001462 [Asterophora parasitica]
MSNVKAGQLAEISAVLHRTLPSNPNASNPLVERDDRGSFVDRAALSREETPDGYAKSIRQSLGTPDSSTAGSRTPEEAPSDVLEDTVQTMAGMDARDQEISRQISQLFTTMSKLRGQSSDLRACIRAEKARRKRLTAFMLYWRQIRSCWTFDEVWSGQMRFFTGVAGELEEEITSSDGETVDHQSPLPGPVLGLDNGGALEIAINSLTSSNMPAKRRREDAESDDEDESRYHPVPRTDEPSEEPTPPSSPPKKRVDKGKGKMPAAQVEEMLREMGGDKYGLHEGENESPSNSSGRRTAQVNGDQALAQVMQEEEFLPVPKAPVGGLVILSPSSRLPHRAASARPL